MGTQGQIRHGERGTVTGPATDVRRASGEPVAVELEVEGTRGWVAFEADTPGREADWTVGEWYRLEAVVGCDPDRVGRTRSERVTDALSSIAGIEALAEDDVDADACPACGRTIDVDGALTLPESLRDRLEGLPGPVHGVGRASLAVEALGSAVDDWRPRPDRWPFDDEEPDRTVVCLDCEADVTAHYRERVAEARRTREADSGETAGSGSGGMQDIVQDALENPEQAMASRESLDASADVGMATGGAKDANNFRDNVREGYVPKPDALAYEGLFYDYYFETGDANPGGGPPGDGRSDRTSDDGNEGLFYPSYARAVTESPLSGERERYLTVGLNSTLTEGDLERKPLNLVAVVDVSGSMDSPFDQYYYDEHGNRQEVEADGETGSKLAAARRALSSLTEQLRAEDRLGVVLYDGEAHVAKPLRSVGETDMDAIRGHVEDITAGGSTNMSAGFDAAMDLLEPHHGTDLESVENRVVFMTDAMPNRGATGEADIVDRFDDAAGKHVHTTFVGIGLDANAELVESISGVRGANHYFIHSTAEFERRLSEEFTYMVTPLVFDLSLDLVSDGYEIEAVYGSPNADRATGEVMHVTTLFPSPTSDGETRGGVTLLRLRATDPGASLELVANWVERDGTRGRTVNTVSFPDDGTDHFDDSGVRKAVFLSRYGRLLREWAGAIRADDDTSADAGDGPVDDWTPREERDLDRWEERSVPLSVPDRYREAFETFRRHALAETEAIGDETLSRETDLLALLCDPDAVERARAGDPDKRADDSPDEPVDDGPHACPSCGADVSTYGPVPFFCPECGVTVD